MAILELAQGYFLGIVCIEVDAKILVQKRIEVCMVGVLQVRSLAAVADRAPAAFLPEAQQSTPVQQLETSVELLNVRAH